MEPTEETTRPPTGLDEDIWVWTWDAHGDPIMRRTR